MIFPDSDAPSETLTHRLVIHGIPELSHRNAFIFGFKPFKGLTFIRSSVAKADGTARLFFRTRNADNARIVLTRAKNAFREFEVTLHRIYED